MVNDKPVDAPQHCPGTSSDQAGKATPCQGCPNQQLCSSGQAKGPDPDAEKIRSRLAGVKHKILILSGKGGVGKSTVSCCLARALALDSNRQVALLDVDICGPSVPTMMGLQNESVHQSGSGWSPVFLDDNLSVMSVGFLLSSPDDAVVWRGPRKSGLLRQFLRDVDWGEQDFLLIDTPPGTSDEHLSIVQLLASAGVKIDGAIVVTTPQEVALMDVRKEVNFCKRVNVPILGLVENMSSFNCAACGLSSELFPTAPDGGVTAYCQRNQLPLLAKLPAEPAIAQACDSGLSPFDSVPNSNALAAIRIVAAQIAAAVKQDEL